MAENATWLINNGPPEKSVIWAHNLHIGKEAYLGDHELMGQYLSKNFDNAYYALGFGYDRGILRAYDFKQGKYGEYEMKTTSKTNSSNYIFKQTMISNFILDFHNANNTAELKEFLNRKMLFRDLGAFFYPESNTGKAYVNIALAKVFDGLIFIRETTAAKKFQNVRR
jgi:erythromycin esterase-like protein